MTGVPQPPDQRAAIWDPLAKQLESIVLATVHMWTLCQHKTLTVPMILRHFVAADVFNSMCELCVSMVRTSQVDTEIQQIDQLVSCMLESFMT